MRGKNKNKKKLHQDDKSLTASLRCNVIVKRYKDDLYGVILLLKMSSKKEKLDLIKQKILKRFL